MARYTNNHCPVCEQAFTDADDIVVCPECGTPYHRECWKKVGACVHEAEHAVGFEWKPDADPADLFAERCDAYRAKLEADKTAGALLPDEAAARTRTLALLTAWSRSLDNGLDADEAFDTVRSAFNAQVQRREEAVSTASNALEFAFDFMEQAFEDGQEMVVFVNELALGPDSAPFLAENDCERFEQYSEKLLLHGGEDELLAELQRDDVRAEEHSAEF